MPIPMRSLGLAVLLSWGGAIGCDSNSGGAVSGEAIDPAGPGVAGTYTKCTYTPPASLGYSAAQVIYPCEKTKGPFAATTLTGGWTNTYPMMKWLSDHLVTHGYVVFAMTPNNNMGLNPEWTTAHKTGISMLQSENARTGAAIKGLVNTSRLRIMGFSKGGGGSLLASASLGATVKTTQAIAPYMDFSYNLSNIKGPVAIYSGSTDNVASPALAQLMYANLPWSIPRMFAKFNGMGHMDWVVDWMGSSGDPTYQARAKTYITAFMKTHLEGLTGYESHLDGKQTNWFTTFQSSGM